MVKFDIHKYNPSIVSSHRSTVVQEDKQRIVDDSCLSCFMSLGVGVESGVKVGSLADDTFQRLRIRSNIWKLCVLLSSFAPFFCNVSAISCGSGFFTLQTCHLPLFLYFFFSAAVGCQNEVMGLLVFEIILSHESKYAA